MVFIESAFWGDEKSTKNVTQVLNEKVVGNKLTIDEVDDKLIPAFTVTPKGELTEKDVREINKKADEACGGAADQDCLRLRKSELTQAALRERANENITAESQNIIKGKRLTVNLRDENGKLIRKVVPEKGRFELEGLSSSDPRKKGQALPPAAYIQKQFLELTGVSFATFVWVFSVVATYTVFSREGWKYGAPVLALIAFLLPNSGYVMIIGYYATRSFVNNYTTMV
jgi:hypothetical protein